jgi:asparagine synthase (glutamine-hydrolysing)
VAAMVRAMLREPFYRCGTHSVPEVGTHIGWVDGRDGRSHARLIHRHGNRTVLFAGEHFGDRESPSHPQHGIDVPSLLSTYDIRGSRCLRELNGWFAGVLIDPERGHTVLFNDRLGLHRVYYMKVAEGVAFASEAKALLAIRSESRRFDPKGLGEFLAVGCVFSGRTLFEGISRLPGGAAWILRPGIGEERHNYFDRAELEAQSPLSDDAFYGELKTTFSRVIPKYLAGDESAAVSLTGGFDSRTILAFAGDAPSPRCSYTYNGLYRECRDVQVARLVAGTCGYQHEVLNLDRTFLREFPRLTEELVWVTDGTADITIAHEVHLSRQARSLAPVRVTGNYGGEMFRGVSTFQPLHLAEGMLTADAVPYVNEALQSFSALRRQHPVSFAAFEEIPSSLYGRLAAAQSQLIVRTPYTDNAALRLAYRLSRPSGRAARAWAQMLTQVNPALAAIPTDRGELGTQSAIRSLPVRFYSYVSFKAEWYYDAGMPAWFSPLDHVGARLHLPAPFIGSHKIQHYRRWFRDHFAEYLASLLNEASSQPFLNPRFCVNAAAEHQSGRRNYVTEISLVATLALVDRLLLKQRPADVRRMIPSVAAAPL